jgi:hypothetical protein
MDDFEIVFHAGDAPPPHVYLFGAGGECVVDLGSSAERPRVRYMEGMSDRDALRAFRLAEQCQAQLLLRWREIHET